MPVQDNTIVTLAEMRQFLNITDSNDTSMDSELIDLLDSYCDFIAKLLGLDQITTKSYSDTYDGNNQKDFYVDHKPIVAVSALTIDDISVGVENTDYYVYLDEGRIELDGDKFDKDNKNVDITYTAGYGTNVAAVPRPLKLALKKWVTAVYRGEVVDYSTRFEEGAYVNFAGMDIPKAVLSILSRYNSDILFNIGAV